MNSNLNETLLELKSDLLDGMREFMSDEEVAYGDAEVDRCGEILDELHAAIPTASDREEALESVRQAIVDLNELNTEADDALIETDQREMICEFIIKLCSSHGFCEADEDITEEWREW